MILAFPACLYTESTVCTADTLYNESDHRVYMDIGFVQETGIYCGLH